MSLRIPRNIALTAALSVLLLVIGSAISYQSLQTLADSTRLEQHARDVLLSLTRTLATLQDAETGQRGYLLTNDPAYLGRYREAMVAATPLTNELRGLVSDNPEQLRHLDELERRIDARLAILRSTVELAESGERTAAVSLVAAGSGLRAMNEVREVLEAMEREEIRLLEVRANGTAAARQRLRLVMAGTVILGLGLVALLTTVSFRELRAAERSRFTILEANRQLEQRVQERTAELRAANLELESFAYSVSHDLRAPLRAISGFAQILARRHRDGLNDEGRHYMDNVVNASARMGTLIDDLLTYSRVGRTAVRCQPVPLAPLLQRTCSVHAERMTALGATVDVDEPLATPMGDATLLGQVLDNLIDNALSYGRPGVAPAIRVSSRRQNGEIVLEVTDNGIGIPEDCREKVFEVFQRLHSDEQHPGTGIGLAIVRRAARLMGGDADVVPASGHGCQFRVRLPAAPEGTHA